MTASTALFWFTFDLRLQDLPGLQAACDRFDRVIPVFVYDPDAPWAPGGASRWWLHHSLNELAQAIKENGGKLVLRKGDTQQTLLNLCEETKAQALYFSRAYEPWLATVENALHDELSKKNIDCKRYSGRLLFEPEQIKTQQDKPFQVFTPFYRQCLKQFDPSRLLNSRLRFSLHRIKSDKLSDWNLLPKTPNWAEPFNDYWQPGFKRAEDQFQEAVNERIKHYPEQRDFPALDGTSRLSPHLAWGEISPHRIWQTLQQKSGSEYYEAFLRQLIWREFSYHLLHHWPHITDKPFKNDFEKFPWRTRSEKLLKSWQNGATGYPIIDAGMRQLWQSGWMHNRVRMITASFLTKHLRVHWREGARWFWDTLVDADLANNSAGWQWVAGSGADAAPYFRIFNPVLQGQKFDNRGEYVRTWVPELAKLPDKYLHTPWLAPKDVLKTAGVNLGANYPRPIVDHANARQQALDAYEKIKCERS